MPRTSFRCVAFTPGDPRGFTPPRNHTYLWTRCRRRSHRNDRFCLAHRRALDGIILGLQQWEQRLHGAEKENEAYASIPAKDSVCETCGAGRKWKIPHKRRRPRPRAAKKETPPFAQTHETKVKKRRSCPRLPVAPSEAAGNCPPAPHDERSLAPHGSQ